MSRMLNVVISAALLLSALALSACASKQEPVPVAAPASVEVVAEKPAVVEAVPEPAPQAVTEQPQISAQAAPQKKIHKARKIKAKPAPEKVAPPAPVVEEPAPVAVVTPEPTPPARVAPPPAKKIAEPGLFEQYWMWLLGLLIVIAGVIVWWRKNQAAQ